MPAVLRPGTPPPRGRRRIAAAADPIIRGHFPGVTIRVRLDGGFASPAVLEFLDAQSKLEYVVAMAKNAVLKRIAAPGIGRALSCQKAAEKRNISTEKLTTRLANGSSTPVVIKAEVVRAPEKDPKDNPRFVITNMKQSPQ